MLNDLNFYFTWYELLVALVLVGGTIAAVSWALVWHGRNRVKALEQELADIRSHYDRQYFQVLHDHLQSSVAHEVVKGLDYISNKSAETLQALGQEQNDLRDKQQRIVAKANEMAQHAINITHLFAPEPVSRHSELLSLRRLVEAVLLELYPYAQSKGVVLRPDLADLEPVALDREAALLAIRNVIHNAIRYSPRGGVIDIVLFLEPSPEEARNRACVDVQDAGIGIKDQDRDKIFDLRRRGDSLVEPGCGLGLYCAREAARRLGGDIVLVGSSPNQGSLFRIIFPCGDSDFQ